MGSLFSGIGGLDLGLTWAGMEIVWHSEIDPYASAVLRKHWPYVPNVGNITAIDPASLPAVDLVCGGFPCQPVSHAGRRQGKGDDRWLWPYMRQVIEAARPTWVLGENVVGLVSMGLDGILSDLEDLGYATWQAVIPAASVQAPHIRERVFVVAHADCMRQPQPQGSQPEQWRRIEHGCEGVLADAMCQGLETPQQRRVSSQAERRQQSRPATSECREPWGDAKWITGSDGKTRAVKPGLHLLADGIPDRLGQTKALGNSVVPQIAYEIGRAIMAAHYEVAS